jgi:hypothetical protein
MTSCHWSPAQSVHAWWAADSQFFRTVTEEFQDYVVSAVAGVGASANNPQFRRAPQLLIEAGNVAS